MDFLAIYLLAMVVPGALLACVLGLHPNRAVASIALSLLVLVLTLLAARAAGLGTSGFGYLLAVVYGVIILAAGGSWRSGGAQWRFKPWAGISEGTPAVVLAAAGAYMLWAGPYTEVPSDAWWHIGRINDQLHRVTAGSIGSLAGLDNIFNKFELYWYTLLAYFLHLSGRGLGESLDYIAMGNTLLFCGGVYAFSFRIFDEIVPSRPTRHAVAAASVFFFVAHFGISVFSYVRYYVYAPTILNYIVYLAAVACVLTFLRQERGGYRHLGVAVSLTVVAAMLHLQEAVFIGIMAGAVVVVTVLARAGSGVLASAAGSHRGYRGWLTADRATVSFWLFVIVYLLLHITAYVTITRHNPLAHGVMDDIRNYLPFLRNLYVLKPGHQFYQVVTVWGLVVYVLFLASWRRFSEAPFLRAGMLIPVLTVFNPVFNDLFLRYSWPEVLWRMCYMIPLPLLGGYFLVMACKAGFERRATAARLAAPVTAAALLGLLLPVQSTFLVSPYSKIHTLKRVEAANDHRLWKDLIDFLSTRERTRIITDRVTGYVVNGLTHHVYGGYKFYDVARFKVDRDGYRKRDFMRKDEWMVVINMRDGAPSMVGRHGGHWPEDIMQVSRLYSNEFLEYVRDRPALFERIWDSAEIEVYRIRS